MGSCCVKNSDSSTSKSQSKYAVPAEHSCDAGPQSEVTAVDEWDGLNEDSSIGTGAAMGRKSSEKKLDSERESSFELSTSPTPPSAAPVRVFSRPKFDLPPRRKSSSSGIVIAATVVPMIASAAGDDDDDDGLEVVECADDCQADFSIQYSLAGLSRKRPT